MKISEYKRRWREFELLNGRSPKTGRPLRKWLTVELRKRAGTKPQYAALAHYTKLIRRDVDHETAYLAAYGKADPQSVRMLDSFLRRGILVGDFPKHY
jgi:hypothetical protein